MLQRIAEQQLDTSVVTLDCYVVEPPMLLSSSWRRWGRVSRQKKGRQLRWQVGGVTDALDRQERNNVERVER